MVDGVMQLSTLCLEFGIALLQFEELQFKQNSDHFYMIKWDFDLTSFQLDCLLLGKRSVLSPLIFATTLSLMVHVFFDVCCPCFTTGKLLVNGLKYVPWGPASSESLVASSLKWKWICKWVNNEKYLWCPIWWHTMSYCPYCCFSIYCWIVLWIVQNS